MAKKNNNVVREISGKKYIVTDRELPGTIPNEIREYRYIADDGNDYFIGKKRSKKKSLFDKVTTQFEIALSGTVITENCKLWLPTNELFHAVSYWKDIEGWRKQVEQGAKHLGLLTGKIVENKIVLSDGRAYDLQECQIEIEGTQLIEIDE